MVYHFCPSGVNGVPIISFKSIQQGTPLAGLVRFVIPQVNSHMLYGRINLPFGFQKTQTRLMCRGYFSNLNDVKLQIKSVFSH
jgi:hypothetical protein